MAAPLSPHTWGNKPNTRSSGKSFALCAFFLTFDCDFRTGVGDNATERQQKLILPDEFTAATTKDCNTCHRPGEQEPWAPGTAVGARQATAPAQRRLVALCTAPQCELTGAATTAQRLPEGTAAAPP